MILASWIVLLAASVLCGVIVVSAMALPRHWHLLLIALTVVTASVAIVGVTGVSVYSGRTDETLIAVALGIAAFFGGFALGGTMLPMLGREREWAALPDPLPEAVAGTAVVLLACAESEHYEPSAVARSLTRLEDAGVALPPEAARVFVYASEKARYRVAGMSPARATCRAIAERLDDDLAGDGFLTVRTAWCDGRPALDARVAELAGEGVRDIVVAQLTIAEDGTFSRIKRRVDSMRPGDRGVRIAYTDPLWGASAIAERAAARILEHIGDVSPATVGVALLGHGQPTELERTNPSLAEHETLFMQRIRAELVDLGFDSGRIRLGWMEWQDPGATEVVRHLAALGCTRVVVVPATSPVNTLTATLDMRDAIVHARVENAADVELLPTLGDDPVVAEVLAARIRQAASEL